MSDTPPAFNPQASALVQDLGRSIVNSPRIASQDWRDLVMVAVVRDDHASMSGFVYDGGGKSRPVTPGGGMALQQVQALREATQVEGKTPWQACMIRINRESGKIHVDFEYEQPGKWEITPANVRKKADELRPMASAAS